MLSCSHSSRKKWLFLILILTSVVSVAGCATQAESTPSSTKKAVTLLKIAETEERSNITFTGEVITLQQATLSFEINGKLNTLHIDEGHFVKKNQVVATLNNMDYVLQLNNANLQYQVSQTKYEKLINGSREEEIQQTEKEIEMVTTQLEHAENNYNRTKRLVEDGALPKIELETSETSLKIIQQQLEKAQIALSLQLNGAREEDIELQKLEQELMKSNIEMAGNTLQKTKLTSPFEGIISKKFSEVGEAVSPGKSIVEITQINPLYVQVDVPASILTQLQENQIVDVYLPEMNLSVEGKVTNKNVIANKSTKNYSVEIEIENSEYTIFPGLLAEVQLISLKEKGIWLPSQAVINRGENQPYVFVYDEGTQKVSQRKVSIERMKGDSLLVAEGLVPKESIVVQGAAFVADGDIVEVFEEEGAKP